MHYVAPRTTTAEVWLRFLPPSRGKVGGGAARMGGLDQRADRRTIESGLASPPSVSLREPPSPARGEGK